MRHVVNLVAALVLAAIAGGAVIASRSGEHFEARLEQTRTSVVKISDEMVLRSQSGQADNNPRGWAETIVPAWFGGELPPNMLLDGDRPWMEVASVEQADWEHPWPLFDVTGHDSAFWYNPALGIVRARVAMLATDEQTLAAYNRVNNTSLKSLGQPARTHRNTQTGDNSSD
ncbi:MAG TPA: hypothetical protein ENJ00_03980 [Phycisphaerales bacterium]|nr:hypothetical protein [Phycisphaerales bacterium]